MATEINLQCLLGLRCQNFTMIAADQTHTQGIIVMKNDETKLHEIADGILMGVIGNAGDARQFAQFISKNLQLYKMKNDYELDTPAVVHFIRKNLGDGLRTGTPSLINMMIAGYEEKTGGQLFAMDVLASCMKVPFASHGFGGILSLGIMDRYHKDDLTESEAYEVLKLCVQEIHQRLFVSLPNFLVKVVSRSGVRDLPIINSASFTVAN